MYHMGMQIGFSKISSCHARPVSVCTMRSIHGTKPCSRRIFGRCSSRWESFKLCWLSYLVPMKMSNLLFLAGWRTECAHILCVHACFCMHTWVPGLSMDWVSSPGAVAPTASGRPPPHAARHGRLPETSESVRGFRDLGSLSDLSKALKGCLQIL